MVFLNTKEEYSLMYETESKSKSEFINYFVYNNVTNAKCIISQHNNPFFQHILRSSSQVF
jgi:hypothetical protein